MNQLIVYYIIILYYVSMRIGDIWHIREGISYKLQFNILNLNLNPLQ